MAKKKQENSLSYLQMPLPTSGKQYRSIKVDWSSFTRRYEKDTGQLSAEMNISTKYAPCLAPCEHHAPVKVYNCPICMLGFADFLLVVYREGDEVLLDYKTATQTYTGVLKAHISDGNDLAVRSIVQFNVYEDDETIVAGHYEKKLLIFPDKLVMDYTVTQESLDQRGLIKLYSMETQGNAVPDIQYAAVHLSRLFGVGKGAVYASKFNNYADFNLDLPTEYNEASAWMSTAQANIKAGGEFTGITAFQNHVILFKKDFMHELYNNKNPFRIQDIYAEGAIDQRTICEVAGNLIFVSEDNVKVYTGGKPRAISYDLNIGKYTYAVAGADDRNYYLYCEDEAEHRYLFVYDTLVGVWSQRAVEDRILAFAYAMGRMYFLDTERDPYESMSPYTGVLTEMDPDNYLLQNWYFETDFVTNGSVDIKHIQKIQMLAEVVEGHAGRVRVYLLYDGERFDESTSACVYDSGARGPGRFPIRFVPRKTANYGYKVRVQGTGFVKLYQMEIITSAGGALDV